MDSPDPRSAVRAAFGVLRRITRIVQLAPFAYLVFYAAYHLACSFVDENLVCLADSAMMLPPVAYLALLAASRILRLCAWHKVACLFPATSQIEGFIDSHVFTFTQEEIMFINAALGFAAAWFLVAAVRHFTHGRKKASD